MAKYVVDGAQLECTLGVAPSDMVVTDHRVLLKEKNRANINDAKPLINIFPFGGCTITSPPKPCTPACTIWMNGDNDVLLNDIPSLLDSSSLFCAAGGGIITVKNCGQ
jgi:hypothetical protein